MDWEKIAANFGLPGLMLGALAYVFRLWISSHEKVELERIKVEDKKADAMTSALVSLGGKVDSHHTADIQSHADLGEGIAEIRGKLDEAIASRPGTPVRGIPTEYSHGRPRTRNDGDR